MRIDALFKPETITNDEHHRLADPYLDAKAKRLVATDGHAMLVVPVEVADGEQSRWIDGRALAAARAWAGPDATVELTGDEAAFGVVRECAQDRKRPFPEWAEALGPLREGDPGTVTFGIDVDKLVAIVDALGGRKRERRAIVTMTLRPDGQTRPFLIRRYALAPKVGAFGALMPVAFDDARRGIALPEESKPTPPAVTP